MRWRFAERSLLKRGLDLFSTTLAIIMIQLDQSRTKNKRLMCNNMHYTCMLAHRRRSWCMMVVVLVNLTVWKNDAYWNKCCFSSRSFFFIRFGFYGFEVLHVDTMTITLTDWLWRRFICYGQNNTDASTERTLRYIPNKSSVETLADDRSWPSNSLPQLYYESLACKRYACCFLVIMHWLYYLEETNNVWGEYAAWTPTGLDERPT